MAVIKHLPRDAATGSILGEMEQNGAVIVDDFLTPEVLASFNAEIMPHLEGQQQGSACVNEAVTFFHGSRTRHLTGVAGHSNIFVNNILLHPIYKAVGDYFLLPNCAAYQLNIAHVLDRGPGSGDQMIHRDQDVWPRVLSRMVAHRQFASLLALGDYTAEMGATRIVPGSHKWALDRQPTPDEIAIAEMSPGSAAIYLGSTLHAAGPNTTQVSRRGMHTSFCLGWLRTEENMNLSIPIERARQMPRAALELLAYGIHDGLANGEGFLGAVDNQNPTDLIIAGKL